MGDEAELPRQRRSPVVAGGNGKHLQLGETEGEVRRGPIGDEGDRGVELTDVGHTVRGGVGVPRDERDLGRRWEKMGGHNSDLAHFKGCHDRRGGGERDRLSVRQVEREGGVRRSCRRRQPADNCPEPVGAGVRCGSAMRPAQDRGGGIMCMWARPHYQGLNLFKPSQADSNKFQFNLNVFKLILIQTRPS
jgi:hypothetical protein